MYNGLGFFEILVIGALVLIFFGSKELPRFLRESGKLLGQLRRYSDKVRRELNDISRSVDVKSQIPVESAYDKKKALRTQYLTARKVLTQEEKSLKSKEICRLLLEMPEISDSKAIMIYVSVGSEVDTRECIRKLVELGKKVVVPFSKHYGFELGIAAITDLDNDLEPGRFNIPEPKSEFKNNFFKSDIQAIVCPGVAFDKRGGRLGRGKGYYDNFLKEFRGRVPIIGLAFDCQILSEPVPFSYNDIPVSQVITESGLLIPKATDSEETAMEEITG